MKLKFLFIVIITTQLFSGCNKSEATGASLTTANVADNQNAVTNSVADNIKEKPPNSGNEANAGEIKQAKTDLKRNSIRLASKLSNKNTDIDGRMKTRELLGWKNFCEDTFWKDIKPAGIYLHMLAEDKYLLEVECNRAGAYLMEYLFYYVDEADLTAQLLSFEIIEKNDTKIPLRSYVSFHPIGETYFDEKTKMLFIRHKYSGAGQCGWEAGYGFVKDKSVLTDLRAEWNCSPGTDFDNWRKLNLKDLRKKAGRRITK